MRRPLKAWQCNYNKEIYFLLQKYLLKYYPKTWFKLYELSFTMFTLEATTRVHVYWSRSNNMSNQKVELGKLIASHKERDAIHIAVFPAIAGEELHPSTPVCLKQNSEEIVIKSDREHAFGIVDPFLTFPVRLRQKFWVCLYPNTIINLRHHWKHRTIDIPSDKEITESREWLSVLAQKMDVSYEYLIGHINYFLLGGNAWIESGSETLRDLFYDNPDLFWDHYERATGDLVADEDRGDCPFSCSC